jgi:hypothetical protein
MVSETVNMRKTSLEYLLTMVDSIQPNYLPGKYTFRNSKHTARVGTMVRAKIKDPLRTLLFISMICLFLLGWDLAVGDDWFSVVHAYS